MEKEQASSRSKSETAKKKKVSADEQVSSSTLEKEVKKGKFGLRAALTPNTEVEGATSSKS